MEEGNAGIGVGVRVAVGVGGRVVGVGLEAVGDGMRVGGVVGVGVDVSSTDVLRTNRVLVAVATLVGVGLLVTVATTGTAISETAVLVGREGVGVAMNELANAPILPPTSKIKTAAITHA